MNAKLFKNIVMAATICALLAGMLALAGCGGGKAVFSSDITDEGLYTITAENAAKDSSVGMIGGGIIVEEGQVFAISPDLQKGSVQVVLLDASGEKALDETIDGRELKEFEIEAGEYSIGVTCRENGTTGTVLIAPVDAAELEKQNQDLEAALKAIA